jgi:hypothetical protein
LFFCFVRRLFSQANAVKRNPTFAGSQWQPIENGETTFGYPKAQTEGREREAVQNEC